MTRPIDEAAELALRQLDEMCGARNSDCLLSGDTCVAMMEDRPCPSAIAGTLRAHIAELEARVAELEGENGELLPELNRLWLLLGRYINHVTSATGQDRIGPSAPFELSEIAEMERYAASAAALPAPPTSREGE